MADKEVEDVEGEELAGGGRGSSGVVLLTKVERMQKEATFENDFPMTSLWTLAIASCPQGETG
jgi:hypothetical protein